MTLLEFLNIKPNQHLRFSDEYIYAYGGILLNCYTGEVITLNTEETIAKQLNIKKFPFIIKDKRGNTIYKEWLDGYWNKCEYDTNGHLTRCEDSNGILEIKENNNLTYRKYKNGSWEKYEYNANGKVTRFERSDGFWYTREYDDNGNLLHDEDSNG
jgi:YD repeat-containing protein